MASTISRLLKVKLIVWSRAILPTKVSVLCSGPGTVGHQQVLVKSDFSSDLQSWCGYNSTSCFSFLPVFLFIPPPHPVEVSSESEICARLGGGGGGVRKCKCLPWGILRLHISYVGVSWSPQHHKLEVLYCNVLILIRFLRPLKSHSKPFLGSIAICFLCRPLSLWSGVHLSSSPSALVCSFRISKQLSFPDWDF